MTMTMDKVPAQLAVIADLLAGVIGRVTTLREEISVSKDELDTELKSIEEETIRAFEKLGGLRTVAEHGNWRLMAQADGVSLPTGDDGGKSE